MMRVCSIFFVFLLSTEAWCGTPHPYSISWIHADIQENKIRLSIKTTAEDLIYFHNLDFDSMFRISREKLETAAQAHIHTLKTSVYILDQHKNKLSAILSHTNLSSLNAKTEYGVMELLKYPLFYTLEFNMDVTTDVLTFHQHLSDAGIPAVSFLSISKGGNSLAENIELSKEKPFTFGRNAISLGNAAEGNFMVSYITVTDTRVLHELTLPLSVLKSFITVHTSTDDAVLKTIHDFVNTNSAVEINNITIQPEITAVDFQHGSTEVINDLSLVNIQVEYHLTSLPKDVAISWNTFNWKLRWFKSLIDSFGELEEHNFSRFQPTFNTTKKQEALKIKTN